MLLKNAWQAEPSGATRHEASGSPTPTSRPSTALNKLFQRASVGQAASPGRTLANGVVFPVAAIDRAVPESENRLLAVAAFRNDRRSIAKPSS
jgi:hypothetical protein